MPEHVTPEAVPPQRGMNVVGVGSRVNQGESGPNLEPGVEGRPTSLSVDTETVCDVDAEFTRYLAKIQRLMNRKAEMTVEGGQSTGTVPR